MSQSNKQQYDHKVMADLLVQFHSLKCICKQHGLQMPALLLDAAAEDLRENALAASDLTAEELYAVYDPFEASNIIPN